jgi:hypothetical protein
MDTDTDPLGDLDLPPALMAAPRAFVAWSRKQLLVEEKKSTPVEPVYHYTGEASLRGILSGRKLWCFSHLHQSDPTEFEFALAIARQVIREHRDANSDFFARAFCECLDDMLEVNALAGPFDFYLFSLSRHRDHGRQWRIYGQEGRGYAIGFGPSLFQPDKPDVYPEANRNLHIGRVVYGDAATAARHRRAIARAAAITSRVGNAHPDLVRAVRPSHYLAVMAHELLASQLIWNCLTSKHRRYAREREVRGIILNTRAKFDPWRRTHDGREYVEHELPLVASGALPRY